MTRECIFKMTTNDRLRRMLGLSFVVFLFCATATAQSLTLVELNCENLFDIRHDEGKEDEEFTPEGMRHWSPSRYWRKLNHTGQTILSCSRYVPDLVALLEVENDTVMFDLTRRSLLRGARYEYLITDSDDDRGVDVALLYQPSSFRPICYDELAVSLLDDMRPTRNILYVKGEVITGDTLHIFVIHAPSRYGGEHLSMDFRLQVAKRLVQAVDSVRSGEPDALVLAAGDFNDDLKSRSMRYLLKHGLVSLTTAVRGLNGSWSNYYYQGRWQQIDHVLCTPPLVVCHEAHYANDAPFLMEKDTKYGGMRPFRTFMGYKYQRGFSDHLPLVLRLALGRLGNRAPAAHGLRSPSSTPALSDSVPAVPETH